VRDPGAVPGGDPVSLPSAAEVEHAEWPALKEVASTLGLNPKGRSAIVRQRILDHLRTAREEAEWRPGKAEQAVLLTHLGFADAAVKLWEATISLDSPAPWVGLGTAYERAGMLEEAVKCFDRAIQMGDVAARLHKAHALTRAGAPDLALAEIDRTLADRPGDTRAWAHRAALIESTGRWEEAIAAHTRIADLTHNRFGLARALMKALRFQEAEAALASHLADHPEDAVAGNNRGVCLAKLGRWKEALDVLRRAAAIHGSDAGILNNLACVLSAMGKTDEALRKLRAARRISEDPRVLLNEAMLLERKMPAVAQERYARVLAVSPKKPEALAGKRSVTRPRKKATKRVVKARRKRRPAKAKTSPKRRHRR